MTTRGYSNGLELVEASTEGWAVFSHINGECPEFVAFVTDEKRARRMAKRTFDGTWELAVLTPHGIVSANDYEIATHAELRARIAATPAEEEAGDG
jgi:hypothetical protein